MTRTGAQVWSRRGRQGRPTAAARLLLAWTLAYLILFQAVVGAVAAGAMAAHDGSASFLCTQGGPAPADGAPHDALMRGLHCALCPAAGGVPLLPAPPRLPLPFTFADDAHGSVPAGTFPAPAPVCENARSRAPPAIG